MARTPNSFPGERLEESILFDALSSGSEPTITGSLRYINGLTGSFSMRDDLGIFNPRKNQVSITDTTQEFLSDKFVTGTNNVSIEIINSGGNEKLKISVSGSTTPIATQIGQVLYSVNGINFLPELPVTSDNGWLINEQGILLIV